MAAINRPILLVSSPRIPIEELLDRASSAGGVIQFFDEEVIACREHLDFAYLNAVKIHERKESRTKSLSMEMLLCAAMTSQIGDAIKKVGVKSARPFVVFAESKKAYAKMLPHLINPVEFSPGKKEIGVRIKRLGIASGTVEDLIQEIALHAMDR